MFWVFFLPVTQQWFAFLKVFMSSHKWLWSSQDKNMTETWGETCI